MSTVKCENPECSQLAKMKCPTCVKMGIDSFFCGQQCFKGKRKLRISFYDAKFFCWMFFRILEAAQVTACNGL